jgi:hypothetical protein
MKAGIVVAAVVVAVVAVAVVVAVVALVVPQHMVPRILVFELMARTDVDEEHMGVDQRLVRKDEELLV